MVDLSLFDLSVPFQKLKKFMWSAPFHFLLLLNRLHRSFLMLKEGLKVGKNSSGALVVQDSYGHWMKLLF